MNDIVLQWVAAQKKHKAEIEAKYPHGFTFVSSNEELFRLTEGSDKDIGFAYVQFEAMSTFDTWTYFYQVNVKTEEDELFFKLKYG